MRDQWRLSPTEPSRDEDPQLRYNRLLKGVVGDVASALKDPSTTTALESQGVDVEGMRVYASVLAHRATRNDAGGDEFSQKLTS